MALDLNKTARADSQRVYTPQVVVDCSKINVPTDGKVNVMDIPAGFDVQIVRTEVLTAEGSSLTVNVGDSGGANVFDGGSGLETNDDTIDHMDTDGGSNSPYTSDDVLQLKFDITPGTTVLRVTAVFFDLGVQ